jgi:Tol biopolymer transport system component
MRTKSLLLLFFFLSLVAVGCNPSGGSSLLKTTNTFAAPGTIVLPTLTRDSTVTYSPLATPTNSTILAATITFTPSLTTTLTVTTAPVAMPHLRVVYIDNNIYSYWTIEPPSQPIQLLSNHHDLGSEYNPGYAQLSGNGNEIVFMGERCPQTNVGIDIISFKGGNIRTLLTPDQIAHLETLSDSSYICGIWKYSLVPGTSRMIFTTAGLFVQSEGPVSDLFSIDVETGVLRQLRSKDSGGIPELSPDGKKMTLTRCTSISLASINGSELYPNVISYTQWSYKCIYPNIVWAADSSAFGMLIQSEKNVTVLSVNASDGIATTLVTLEKDFEGVLSPTLDCIVDNRPDTESTDIYPYLVSLEGTTPLRLLKMGSSKFISFSPDGKHFAFSKEDNTSNPTLYIGTLDGNVTKISEMRDSQLFRWINNLQFVYLKKDSIQLGDINGNSNLLALASGIWFDAIDVDFRKG